MFRNIFNLLVYIMYNITMDSRCIPRIYGPRPRREEVCGSILAEPKARLISNRKLPTGEVEVRIFAGIHRISMVHIIYTMIYGLLSPPKLVHYRAICGLQCAPKLV